MLANRFVSTKSRGGFDRNNLERKSHSAEKKRRSQKNKPRIYRAGSLRKPNF